MIRLRSLLFSAWFFAVSFVMAAFGQILVVVAPRSLVAYARLWSRAILWALPVCGIRVEISGREHLPAGGPMIIASMHQSAFDTLIWFALVPKCRYVVKIELTRIPLFGRLAILSEQIPVDRAGGGATLRGLLRSGGQALANGCQVVIFPEGTRVATGKLAPLQPGVAALARAANVMVVPVATDSRICWRSGPLGRRPGVIHVAIQPPIEAGLRREALMERLQTALEQGHATLSSPLGLVENSVG